jgi:ceramide glucosyltransferase
MLNAWYGAVAAAAAGPRHELPFIMGQLMIWKREAITEIGGLECADGQLVDDMYLGRRVAEIGMHNLLSERPLRIIGDNLSAGAFLRLFRRWLVFGIHGLPPRFVRTSWVRGGFAWLAIIALVLALVYGWTSTALAATGALALLCVSDVFLHRAVGGAPIALHWWWLGLSVPLLGPWMMLSVLFNHHLGWRGRDYTLDNTAHLSKAIPRTERRAS